MNAPDPKKAVFLDHGQQKLVIVKESKLVNAATFYFAKEDHTLGNMLRHSLLRDKSVRFAGYRMPHPLQTVCEVKVQTTGETQPVTAVIDALESLQFEFETLENRFKVALGKGGETGHDHDNMLGGFKA